MIPGSVCSETSDQHKIVNVMTVDHRSMWRRTQILTYILSHQWTWATSRNATHRIPRSPSLSHDDPVASFHPLSSRTFPPSARKSALLASLAQNANLVSQLWTIAAQSLSLPSMTTKKKRTGIPGSTYSLVSWFMCFFPVTKSSYVHSLCGWDWRKLSSKFADIWCWGTNCGHPPQDTKDCSLKYKPCFLYYCYLYDFGGKCERADFYFFFFFSMFWKIVWSVKL